MSISSQKKIDEFTARNPQIADWIIANHNTSSFASSLLYQVRNYGMLTERQEKKVLEILERQNVV